MLSWAGWRAAGCLRTCATRLIPTSAVVMPGEERANWIARSASVSSPRASTMNASSPAPSSPVAGSRSQPARFPEPRRPRSTSPPARAGIDLAALALRSSPDCRVVARSGTCACRRPRRAPAVRSPRAKESLPRPRAGESPTTWPRRRNVSFPFSCRFQKFESGHPYKNSSRGTSLSCVSGL